VLFSALVYFLPQQKIATQTNFNGMAKETAHQIGTPLSSLESENVDESKRLRLY
jgi:hypothetical protein